MNEDITSKKLDLQRRNRQYVFLKNLTGTPFESLGARITFLSAEESSRHKQAVRRATPIGSETYFTDQHSMMERVSNWLTQQEGRLVFFSSAGAFTLDSGETPSAEGFLELFMDESGIAREDLTSGVKYGYCEGYYFQIWTEYANKSQQPQSTA